MMDEKDYLWATKKCPPKTKPSAKPLPKAKEKYLEIEDFEHTLNVFGLNNVLHGKNRQMVGFFNGGFLYS